jgi:beta-xylosidase
MPHNPILRGFNLDPSLCRVGDDCYIATSTFERYPGVQIHHSADLVNWQLAARALSAGKPVGHAGQSGQLRCLRAVFVFCRGAVLAGLYGCEAL